MTIDDWDQGRALQRILIEKFSYDEIVQFCFDNFVESVSFREVKKGVLAKKVVDYYKLTRSLSELQAAVDHFLREREYRAFPDRLYADSEKLYSEASRYLENGRRDLATNRLVKLVNLNPNYKDVTSKLHFAITGIKFEDLVKKLQMYDALASKLENKIADNDRVIEELTKKYEGIRAKHDFKHHEVDLPSERIIYRNTSNIEVRQIQGDGDETLHMQELLGAAERGEGAVLEPIQQAFDKESSQLIKWRRLSATLLALSGVLLLIALDASNIWLWYEGHMNKLRIILSYLLVLLGLSGAIGHPRERRFYLSVVVCGVIIAAVTQVI